MIFVCVDPNPNPLPNPNRGKSNPNPTPNPNPTSLQSLYTIKRFIFDSILSTWPPSPPTSIPAPSPKPSVAKHLEIQIGWKR